MVFHSLRNHDKPLIIDQVKYMRELLEYMLEQCCEVVHDYSKYKYLKLFSHGFVANRMKFKTPVTLDLC